MPHQCVHCSAIYPDGSAEVLRGCVCGGKFFFYLTDEKLKKIQAKSEQVQELSTEEKNQIEQDVREIAGIPINDEVPVVLDFESVKILKPGKYLIDIGNLFSKERPLVYKLDEGKYIIDLTSQIRPKKD